MDIQRGLERQQQKSEVYKEIKEVLSVAYDTTIPDFNTFNLIS